MNSGYADYVIAQIEELLDHYPIDGLFIDITRYIGAPCASAMSAWRRCRRTAATRPTHASSMLRAGCRVRLYAPRHGCHSYTQARYSIFYNSRLRMEWDATLGNRAELNDFTHLEIELLPGGFWGYDHFPLYVRFFQGFGRELLAMNGRFHTAWGDFGGLRNRAALEFECFQGLAHGAACSIGDQLHPRGRLNPAVYARIGQVYAEVERRERWCHDTQPLPEIGVLTARGGPGRRGDDAIGISLSDTGALHAGAAQAPVPIPRRRQRPGTLRAADPARRGGD